MRTVSNIFDKKSTHILRCLLVNQQNDWTVREVAEEAKSSTGYTHAVLTTLTNMQYLKRTQTHKLRLVNPDLLLKRWAAYHQYTCANTFLQYYTFDREIDHFIQTLAERLRNEEYALTAFSGAWLVSPYVRPADIHLYAKTAVEAEKIARNLDIKPTEGSGNVKIVIPPDEGVFYGAQTVEGAKVVSNVQLFVDLWNFSSRGEDAAKSIYALLEHQWNSQLASAINVR
jgi:hypothetical protein